MEKIKIFENKEKEIDLDTLIDSRGLILANSGAGKSYTARKILEESNGEIMSIVIDFEGEFKTLRESYDFLVVGPDGDIPLNIKSAHLLPRKLLELNLSTVIDVSELKRPDRAKYVQKFIEALMEIPRNSGLWKPCFIFIDEIHNLAGQQEKQESTYAIIDLATRGRKRGYSLIGCTQRISKLHKDVVAELNNYFAGRTSLDIDMKRTADILGFNTKEDMLSLRNLGDGEFYVFGPAISKKVEKEQVAKSKTSHPKRGAIASKEINPLTEKIKKTLKSLSDLPEDAKKELKELNDYKIEIVRLKTELRKKPVETKIKEIVKVDQVALQKAKAQGFKEAEIGYRSYTNSIEKDSQNLRKSVIKLIKDAERIVQSKELSKMGDIQMKPLAINTPGRRTMPEHTTSVSQVSHKTPASVPQNYDSGGNNNFGVCARKIYSFLFANPGREFTKPQVSFMTGYSISGNFNNSIYSLTSEGLVLKNGAMLSLGEADPSVATESQEEFRKELFLKRLPLASQKIFEILWERSDEEFSKQDLSEITGYSISGNFNNAIYKLTGLKFAVKNGTSIKLNPEVLELE